MAKTQKIRNMAKLAMIRQTLARQANADKLRRSFKIQNVKPKRKTKKNLVQQAMNIERELRRSSRLKEKALNPKAAPKLEGPVPKKQAKKLIKPNIIYPTSLKPGGLTQNNVNKIKEIDNAWEKYIAKRTATIAVNHRPVKVENLPEFNALAQTLGRIHI